MSKPAISVRLGAQLQRISLGIVVTTLVVGCAPVPDQAKHSVQEYRADRDLRARQFALCANDPGGLGRSADCVNVRAAMQTEDIGSMRDLPELRLPPHQVLEN